MRPIAWLRGRAILLILPRRQDQLKMRWPRPSPYSKPEGGIQHIPTQCPTHQTTMPSLTRPSPGAILCGRPRSNMARARRRLVASMAESSSRTLPCQVPHRRGFDRSASWVEEGAWVGWQVRSWARTVSGAVKLSSLQRRRRRNEYD